MLIFQKAVGEFGLNHLSKTSHETLQNKFQGHNELLRLTHSLKTSDQPHDSFWKNISALDQIRSTDFRELNPEWSKLIS